MEEVQEVTTNLKCINIILLGNDNTVINIPPDDSVPSCNDSIDNTGNQN